MMTNHDSIRAATVYLRDKDEARCARDARRRDRATFALFVLAIGMMVACLSGLYALRADAAEPPAVLAVEPPALSCFSTLQETMDYLLPDDAGTPWSHLATVKHTKRRVTVLMQPDPDYNHTGYDLWAITLRRGCPTMVWVYNFGWDRGWLLLATN